MGTFEDKVVLITGGTRGIGLALVRAFAAEGAAIAYCGASRESIARAELALGQSDQLHAISADLAEASAPAMLVETVRERLGGIDVLVNNAGITGPADPWAVDETAWDRVQAVNLRASFFCARAAARLMQGRGGGSIVNISSVAGQIGGVATGPAYVAAKAGLIGLTRSLARHFAPLGVRVNCIAPADIETDMTAGWPEALRERLKAMTPLGRFAGVDEISGAALFLAGPQAGFITGQTLNVNGGIYMG